MGDSEEKTQTEKTENASATRRGASFPVLALPAAVEVVHKAGEHGPDHHINAFAGYAGHTTTNSGPFRAKLAAIKDWKLVSVNGDRVTLTDLGKKFALSEDPLSEAGALQESFLSCGIFAKFLEETPKGLAQTADSLGKRASISHGVNAATKSGFVKSFTASAVAAGLATSTDEGKSFSFSAPGAPDEDHDETEHEVNGADAVETAGKVTPAAAGGRGAIAGTGKPPVFRQPWTFNDGEVFFSVTSSKPIPADAFALIGEVVKAAAALAEHLGAAEQQETNGDAA